MEMIMNCSSKVAAREISQWKKQSHRSCRRPHHLCHPALLPHRPRYHRSALHQQRCRNCYSRSRRSLNWLARSKILNRMSSPSDVEIVASQSAVCHALTLFSCGCNAISVWAGGMLNAWMYLGRDGRSWTARTARRNGIAARTASYSYHHQPHLSYRDLRRPPDHQMIHSHLCLLPLFHLLAQLSLFWFLHPPLWLPLSRPFPQNAW